MSKLQDLEQEIVPILNQDDDVVFAYLFGSFVKGTEHSKSDVDVAVYFVEGLDFVDKQVALSLELQRAIGLPVDVLVLNWSSVDVCQNILVRGRLVYCRDHKKLAAFKLRCLREYQNFSMMSPIFNHYRKKRIKEGSFGGRTFHRSQTLRHD